MLSTLFFVLAAWTLIGVCVIVFALAVPRFDEWALGLPKGGFVDRSLNFVVLAAITFLGFPIRSAVAGVSEAWPELKVHYREVFWRV